MAKRKSLSKSRSTRRYNRPVGRNVLNTRIARPLPRQIPIQNFDNRFFSFPITTLPRAPITRYGARTNFTPNVKKGKALSVLYRINAPRRTLVCVRRKTRKEVFHALGLAGKKLGTRKVHRNAYSSFSCR